MGCPPQVQAALASVDGVESVNVDFKTKSATVTGSASNADLVKALEGTKFTASVKK